VNIHGLKWMKELQVMCQSAEAKHAAGEKEVGRSEEPGQPTKTKLHEGDLYLCRDSLDALQGALGGVVDGVDAVFTRHKKAFVCIRPPGHHCSADLPSGFCWINNVHVGIEHAALTHGLTHAAIIDFDLHHGDGSQAITWARNTKTSKATKRSLPADRTSIGYFSLHDINSYPCEYGDVEKVQNASLCIENAHAQTIWNVHLQPWASENEFWRHYKERYAILLDKARQYLVTQTERFNSGQPGVQPKAAIFISAGFDASEWESEGMQRHKVNVPTSFYTRFTEDIVKIANETGTSAEGRVVSVLEGGYSDRALTSGIMSHLVGLTSSTFHPSGSTEAPPVNTPAIGHSDWWSSKSLKELESALLPPSTTSAKESRSAEPQAFWSPTRSFSAKVVDPSKLYSSISGARAPTRSPSPPTPEVDWPTATHELCKLLVPSDRQVDSCKYEELAEAKAKRERTSNIMPPPPVPVDRMQLRGRRSGVGFGANPTTTSLPQNGAANELSTRQSGLRIPAVTAAKAASVKLSSNSDQPSVTVRKSRRTSGAVEDLLGSQHVTYSAPTATLPSSQPAAALPGATSMENLTTGVKKIVLRYNGPEDTETPAVKPTKKASILKPAKSNSTAKTASIKSTSSRSLAHAVQMPLSNGKSAHNVQLAPPIVGVEKPIAEDSTTPQPSGKDTLETIQHAASPSSNGVSAIVDSTTQLTSNPVVSSKEITETRVPAAATAIFTTSKAPSAPSTTPTDSQTSSKLPAQTTRDPLAPGATLHSTPETEPPPQTSPSRTPRESNQFIPYIPENGARDNHTNTLASNTNGPPTLTWLAPNTSTPAASPAPKRGNQEATRLPPVFTSDGHIPFAGTDRK